MDFFNVRAFADSPFQYGGTTDGLGYLGAWRVVVLGLWGLDARPCSLALGNARSELFMVGTAATKDDFGGKECVDHHR